MRSAPSIYDLTLNHLSGYDFSRTLFVQGGRQAGYDETVDVLVDRLSLKPASVTLLTSETYHPHPWMAHRRVVNPLPRLSQETASFVSGALDGPPTVVVLTTNARISESWLAVRDHSNLVTFGLSLEPVPTLVVAPGGHIAPLRTFFEISERRFGGSTVTANFLMTMEETAALFDAASTRVDGHVVEVGRFSGASALVLAMAGRACGRPGVHSVDIASLELASYLFARHAVDQDVVCLSGDSLEIATRWRHRDGDRGIGLLFIDGDHSYDGVARDIQCWTPFLVENATLMLHDANLADTGVDRAIYYHLQNNPAYRNLRQIGSLIVCERACAASLESTSRARVARAS